MNLPIPEYGRTDKETIDNLMDTVARLRKELGYALYHLGDDNIPDLAGMKGDINENHTMIIQTAEDITLLAADVSGNTSAINIQANQISSIVSTVNGQSSAITQLSNEISLKVSANGIISAINLSPEVISISADKINLNGITNMNGLANVSQYLNIGTAIDNTSFMRLWGNSGEARFTLSGSQLNVTGPDRINLPGGVYIQNQEAAVVPNTIIKGQYVKKIGAGSDRLFVEFDNGTLHEILFD